MNVEKEMSIQDMIIQAEAIADAQREVEEELKKEEEAQEQSVWIKIRNLFCRTVKKVVTIVCQFLKSEILFIINNEDNQRLAKVAVLTALKLGLKSNAAWAAAWMVLRTGEIVISSGKKVKAEDIKTNILETLLQLVYCCIANKDSKSVTAQITK